MPRSKKVLLKQKKLLAALTQDLNSGNLSSDAALRQLIALIDRNIADPNFCSKMISSLIKNNLVKILFRVYGTQLVPLQLRVVELLEMLSAIKLPEVKSTGT